MWQYIIPAISAIVVAKRSDKNDAEWKMLVGQYFTEVS